MKFLKPIVVIGIIVVVAWNSVYFRDLSEVKSARSASTFNATQYADVLWNTKLPPFFEKAVDLPQLTSMLAADEAKTFDTYSHALGIGNLRYFFVKGNGVIEAVDDDGVTLAMESGGKVTIATEFIFGNAVRDATGLVDINDFTNTMDFNNVSAEINKIIREKVLPPFKSGVKKGDKVSFIGAIELNREHVDLKDIEVMPVQLNIAN